MTVTLNIGFDRGNARTNIATWTDEGRFVEHDASSMIAEGNAARYSLMKQGSGMDALNLNDLIVEYDGVAYFLGEMAAQGKNATTGYGDKGRYHSRHTKVALMGYVSALATRLSVPRAEIIVNLVIGVPLSVYGAERERIVSELTGSYSFQCNGHPVTLHVDSVRVLMEGAGAAIYQGLDNGGHTTGIVDSGSFTTNVLRFDGLRPVTEKCDSFDIGIGTALERLNRQFEKTYGRELDDREQQSVLRAHIGQYAYPELHADGEQVDGLSLRMWLRAAIEETGRDKNARIASLWGEKNAKVAAGFRRVLHIGGGAYYFHPSLQQVIKFASLVPDAELANARGYALLASQIAERKVRREAV